MAERNGPSSIKVGFRNSLFCFFIMASLLFILSWFFVMQSTYHPNPMEYNLIPNSQHLSALDGSKYQMLKQNVESSFGNRKLVKHDGEKCHQNDELVVKVYMYDLPPEFHFGLLNWKPSGSSVWPDVRNNIPGYPGGLNLQHSIEFWLTLDILASEFPRAPKARTVIRVQNSSEADIIYVPFFSSLSYNQYSKGKKNEKKNGNKILQEKLVKHLTTQEQWKRSGGKDHLILAHHPNSMLDARMKLWPATFILSDFGRYPPNIANVEKDVIAPYKHLIPSYLNDNSTFDSRPTLLYFQGAIYRKDGGLARQELFYLLKNEKDVHFSFGSIQKDGIKKATEGMRASKFCLNIAGDTPSSNRLFDAISSHCVPVIISDAIELPYEDVIDYSEFCIFVRTIDAIKENFLINFIRDITKEEWTRMWNKLKEIEHFFEFHFPSKENDAVQMIWQAVARKVPAIRLKLNRHESGHLVTTFASHSVDTDHEEEASFAYSRLSLSPDEDT
ncbi:arabinosyltransferase protein [Vigna angularis]|uniref:Arabinosyltransferase protein n=1 Tax=Phaseolus angularis TaxID=3914 RepID=A0A8T0LFM6_PHAAN|nr:arabinosyltransferase protein [Vigna angularis]